MQNSVLKVVRDGEQWGVAADGEVMALARTKGAAETLAREACAILKASGADARVETPRERRTFKPE